MAWGLRRHRLDRILLDHAESLGARVISERRTPEDTDVVASGRPVWVDRLGDYAAGRLLARVIPPGRGATRISAVSKRTSAAKPAMRPSCSFQYGCVGVNAVEEGLVTVCGLVREHLLREGDFQPDALLSSRPELAARLGRLSRATDWLIEGPVITSDDSIWRRSGPYRAGDALASIEPFTGSGVLNALLTGQMAGMAAARRTPVGEYCRRAESVLGRPLLVGSAIGAALDTGWARILAPVVPVGWLFRLSRPASPAPGAW